MNINMKVSVNTDQIVDTLDACRKDVAQLSEYVKHIQSKYPFVNLEVLIGLDNGKLMEGIRVCEVTESLKTNNYNIKVGYVCDDPDMDVLVQKVKAELDRQDKHTIMVNGINVY